MPFHLGFNQLSLFCILNNLSMIYCVDFLFCSHIFGVLCASCICMSLSFLSLGGLFMILLKIWIALLKLDFLLLSSKTWKVWLFIGAPLFPLNFFPVYTGCEIWAIFESLKRVCRKEHWVYSPG